VASDRPGRVCPASPPPPRIGLAGGRPRSDQQRRHDQSVNYAEVLQKSARRGVPAADVDGELDALTITVSSFGRLDARLAASLLPPPLGPEPGRPCLPGAGAQPGQPRLHHRPALAVLGRRPRRRRSAHTLTTGRGQPAGAMGAVQLPGAMRHLHRGQGGGVGDADRPVDDRRHERRLHPRPAGALDAGGPPGRRRGVAVPPAGKNDDPSGSATASRVGIRRYRR
jgi:hypothetical protein